MAEQEIETGFPGETERKLLEPLLQSGSAVPERTELRKRALRQIAEQGFAPGFTISAAVLTAFRESSSEHNTPEITWQKRLLYQREIGPLVERKIREQKAAPPNEHVQWTVTPTALEAMPAVLRQQFTPGGQLKTNAFVSWLRARRYTSKVEQLAKETGTLSDTDILMQVPLVKIRFTKTMAESTENQEAGVNGTQSGFPWVFVVLAFFAIKGYLSYNWTHDSRQPSRINKPYLTDLRENNYKSLTSPKLPVLDASKVFTPSPKDTSDIIDDFLDQITPQPGRPSFDLLQIGENALTKNGYYEAELAFSEAIAADPEYSVAYYKRGLVFKATAQWELADKDFTRAIELNESKSLYYFQRGQCLMELKRYEEAIRDFSVSIEKDFKRPQVYINRGTCFSEIHNYPEAIADFTNAMKLDPSNDMIRYLRGNAYAKSGQYELAIADFNPSRNRGKNSIQKKNAYAWILATCADEKYQNGELALEVATEVCEQTEWKGPVYLDTLAAAYARCGRFEEAVEQQQKAYDLVSISDKADYYYRLDLYRNQQAYVDPIEAELPEPKTEALPPGGLP